MDTRNPRIPDQHEFLPHIDHVAPLSEQDQACLREVKEVLQNHNALGRFGFQLLHEHFPLESDEILVEYCDIANRTLTIRPLKRYALSREKLIETSWHFASGKALLHCIVKCSC